MPSQFFGLNTAYTGLLASNAALNTTSNNIANVQTEGYSRQKVDQRAAAAIRTFQTYGCAGAGVDTLAIERVRDDFYDGKYWDNNANVGRYDMKAYYMKQVETYFYDNGENAGFNSVFDQLMITGMQELLKNPDNGNTKAQLIGYAENLTEYFNGLAGNLEEVQHDINKEVKLKVDEINSLAGEIATLNKQINTIEMTGVIANELRDRRTLLLDQLSKIVDIKTSETPIVDANNPERETGGNRFIVTIAGGQLLVDNTEFRGLECVGRAIYEKVNQTDIDGLYDVYWEDGQQFNIYNAAMGGNLRGLIEMRDGNNGENFKGLVTGTDTTVVDGVTHDTVTIEINHEYLQDLNKSNLSDQGGIINLGNREFYYDSWEYNCSYDAEGKATYSYTFVLSGSEKNEDRLTNDRLGKMATIGSEVDYMGIPYYMNQMNEWVRTFAQTFNDILEAGCNSYNEDGVKLFTGDHLMDREQFDFPNGEYGTKDTRYDLFTDKAAAGSSISVSDNDDSYYRLTAKNFAILAAMEDNAELLANKYKKSDGVEQSDLLDDLRTIASDKAKMTYRGASSSEFLQLMLSDVALNANGANTFQESFTNIANAIDTQRLSISGVDEDEEAVNLVRYQNGYNLASKMIQTLTEIYDRLILQTGV